MYAVRYKPYDGSSRNDSLLAQVRKDFLTGFKSKSGRVRSFADGTEILSVYKISRSGFSWLRTSGKAVLQKSYRQKGGYYILTRNMEGGVVSKADFNKNHRWLQTAYYAGDITKPAALLKPKQGSGLILLQLCAEEQIYRKKELEPYPCLEGTAEQSFINTLAGEPPVVCETSSGSFYYCLPEEKESREAAEADLKLGNQSVQPDWSREEEVPVHFAYIENDGSAAAEQTREPPLDKPDEITEPCQEVLKEMTGTEYPLDREIFCMEEPERKPAKYTVAAKGLGGGTQISEIIAPHVERAAKRIVISAEESYLYFGKVIEGLREGRGRTQMKNGCTAYEGNYRSDKRDGFGTYYYKSGKICYVGGWKENRRDGVGVSFSSKDGSIFVGKWKDNIPTGIGTAFDVDGNLVYTGEWKDGKRHGHGTEYKNGRIVYTGEFREDRYYSGYQHIESCENPII